MQGTCDVGGLRLSWSIWQGQLLSGKLIALDTETTLIKSPAAVPRLVLGSVSDGKEHLVIRGDDLARFVEMHQDRHWCSHNVAYDFAVLDRYFATTGASAARGWLWSWVEQGRWHDTMLLGSLVGIAESDRDDQLNLEAASERWLGCAGVDKGSGYRTRYSELLGVSWADVDPGFFQYAVSDAIVTWRLYMCLRKIADQIVRNNPLMNATMWRQHGVLTERIQVQAAVSLSRITQRGMRIDADRRQELLDELTLQRDLAWQQMQQRARGYGLLHPRHMGRRCTARDRYLFGLVRDEQSQRPPQKLRQNKMALRLLLQEIATELGVEPQRTEKSNTIKTDAASWESCRQHPFVDAWRRHEDTKKLLQFLENITSRRVHPRYRVCVRTGRTSCSGPNIQQLPRNAGIREMIVPSPGHVFLIADYAAIELRTLAYVCQQRYGFSKLADTIKVGEDPHVKTAAIFRGESLEQFLRLKQTEPKLFKQLRQQAKALNFGVPGGLGSESLVKYAQVTYGVTMSPEEAQEFRQRLISDVYPELELFLSENTATILATNLRADPALVRSQFPTDRLLGAVRKIVSG
ncbi:MAG: hypothetical protein KDB23_18575, partial [Planctomycetales bacterium]|nr:hypothetical protein [Planctomycetales bacterium]